MMIRWISTVFVLNIFLLFNSWHPNLVCSKSGIRRTNPRHPEYRLNGPASGVPKRGLSSSEMTRSPKSSAEMQLLYIEIVSMLEALARSIQFRLTLQSLKVYWPISLCWKLEVFIHAKKIQLIVEVLVSTVFKAFNINSKYRLKTFQYLNELLGPSKKVFQQGTFRRFK